jgi:hypothetical protein
MEANTTTSLWNVTLDIEKHNDKDGDKSNKSNIDNNGGSMLATNKCRHNINCNYKLYIC